MHLISLLTKALRLHLEDSVEILVAVAEDLAARVLLRGGPVLAKVGIEQFVHAPWERMPWSSYGLVYRDLTSQSGFWAFPTQKQPFI